MTTFEKLEGNQVKFTFNVPQNHVESLMDEAYRKNVSHFNIPGFRKGKAPRGMIEKAYGDKIFFGEALEKIFEQYYYSALDAYKIIPKNEPEQDIPSMEDGADFTFSVVVDIDTEKSVVVTKLGEYKGVEVNKSEFAVSDEMVQEELNKRLEQIKKENSRQISVEREVKDGDTVNIDYSGSVNGEKFEGGTAEGQTLVIGSNTFIPGFEEQLIGMNVGDERDITVKFPEEYHSEELKGKEAIFAIKLHNIYETELPELNDEFAQDTSEFDTFADYEASIKSEIAEALQASAKNAMEGNILHKACDNSEISVPEDFVKSEARKLAEQAISRMGMTLEKFCEVVGGTPDETIERFSEQAAVKEQAAVNLKIGALLTEVAYAEKMENNTESVREYTKEFVRAYFGDNMNEEAMNNTVDSMLKSEKYDYFEFNQRLEEAQKLIISSANITE
ncbi:MAG: trigger factor [Clostridiales bacterium]|jgi:trigger factor|nr:trigger factor [Clostridiales bacterium]